MVINEKEARLIFQMGQDNYDNELLNQDMLEFIQEKIQFYRVLILVQKENLTLLC